jgi:hydrogenase maturation factor
VLIGTMLGLAPAGGAIGSGGARAGDALIVVGPVGVEGTAALAAEAATDLQAAGLSQAQLGEAAALLQRPGISVMRASRSLLSAVRPHALHDATEGGVATAMRELAEASKRGLRVRLEALPVLPVTRTVCTALRLDPLGLLSSGCLLAALAQEDVAPALAQLAADGLIAEAAGEFREPGRLVLLENGSPRALPAFDRDEIARYFERRGA